MKKLLLLTNIICFFFLIASCQNTQPPKENNTAESNPVIQDSVITMDTMKSKIQTSASGTIVTGQGTQKDSTNKSGKGTAIVHSAPDQIEIDSIKNAKQKGKK